MDSKDKPAEAGSAPATTSPLGPPPAPVAAPAPVNPSTPATPSSQATSSTPATSSSQATPNATNKQEPLEVSPAPASGTKRKSRRSDVEVEVRTPVKRARVPVSRFQSPIEELEPHFKSDSKPEKRKEDVITLYKKNTFLAVRGAEGTFYLCRTSQNVNSTTKKLSIQWLSLDPNKKNVYQFDYVDRTEMETVLTEVQMDKVSKTHYKLPESEKKRIEKILDRAIRVEQGVSTADEVEEEAMEEADSDDESDNDSDFEKSPSRKKTPNNKGGKKGSTPGGKKKETPKQQKIKASKGGKSSGEKKKGPDRNLKPNAKIKILENDPFFDSKDKVPDISPRLTSKLVFRAVNTDDVDGLKTLLERTEGVAKFSIKRSLRDERNALMVAGELERKQIMKLLIEEFYNTKPSMKKTRKAPQNPIIGSMSTGEYNPMFLGIRNVRALNVSRGNKEGNEAFLKESDPYNNVYGDIAHWMSVGVPVEVMETFLMSYSAAIDETRDDQLPIVIQNIDASLKRGHRLLAGKYVSEAERLSGYGFNYLHKEVLTFEKDDLRDIILAASVRKKPFSNDAVTPLHCAAINPNVKYLRRLLSIEPDMNIQTRSRARPIHYAAVCEGVSPLEFLLERHASPSEADASGELPIHWAAKAGRWKNIEVLIKHAKKEGGVTNEKWGMADVNRPNRFSECPLHLAVKNGHIETVRTLINHGADANRQLSAGKDKMTPLMLASGLGYLNIARTLVQSGAQVELLDKMKRSALTHAVMNGSSCVASYLLYLGADANRVDSSNNTLVHYAAAYGWYFCLKLLLKDAGADPDVPNDWQTTPVNIALLKGNTGIVEMLINHKGVNINFSGDTGITLASTVCKSRLTEGLDATLEALINNYKADPTMTDVNGYNALHHLASNNIKLKGTHWVPEVSQEAMDITVKMAKTLIGAGCNPTLTTKDGKTPIMLAIEQVNVSLVNYLVEQGGTVSADKNSDEKTVLHLMAEQCGATDLTPIIKILAKQRPAVVADKTSPEKCKENGKVNGTDEVSKSEQDKSVEEEKSADQDKPEPMETEQVQGDQAQKTTNGESGDAKPAAVNGGGEVKGDVPDQSGDAKTDKKEDGPEKDIENESKKLKEETKPKDTQLGTLQKMAKDRDFLGFTPLLRACQVYSSLKASTKKSQNIFGFSNSGVSDAARSEFALSFIQALLELTASDVDATVCAKNMPEETESHYAPEGKCSALHFLVTPQCETGADVGKGLKLLLRFHPNPNQKDLKGKTPLIQAVEAEKESAVKTLLEAGADPNVSINIAGQAQVSPLLLAAKRASHGILNLLMDFKADVNSVDSETLQSALHVMVMNRVLEDDTIAIIQKLLHHGANINAVDKLGNTPLHMAIQANRGHSDTSTSMEEFLLERGANVYAKNKQQLMPLHVALDKAGMDPIELCSTLTQAMREMRLDEPTDKAFTPLHYAAASGATICCIHLLQRKVNIEAKEYRGNTPLNLAIYNGHDSCAIMLMQRHASSGLPIVASLPAPVKAAEEDKKRRPVMMWRPKKQWEVFQSKEIPGESMTLFEGAVKNNLTGVAHMLQDTQGVSMPAIEGALNLSKFNLALRMVRRIPDVSRLHARNKWGQNLFHVLANKTNRSCPDLQIKVAGALLEKGVALNLRDNFGLTPLMYAALKHQSVALAKFLIQNDVAYNAKIKDNSQRDIMAAFMWDYNWVSDKFKVDEVRQWLELLCGEGKVCLDTLYDHPLPDPLLLGASIIVEQPDYFDTRGGDRTTPLIFAIRNYDFGLVKYMLQTGASPNFPDSRGLTPMMHAVQMNDVKLVKLLLNYNYDLETDSVVAAKKHLKVQLSKEQSRQVLNINFLTSKEKNPDDIVDEEIGIEDDAVSLSKHTEEDDDSIDLNEDEEKDFENLLEEEENIDFDEEKGDNADDDSDGDTDIVEDDEPVDEPSKPDIPKGAKKLSLSRHVSQMMNEKQYSSMEKTSAVDLSKADSKGWTAAHHAVCSLEQATFDNGEVVYLLGKAGAPLEARTSAGETVMMLAQKTGAPEVVKVLNKLLALEPYNKTMEKFSATPSAFVVKESMTDVTKPDYRGDADKMLERLDAAAAGDAAQGPPRPKPDTNCEIKNTGEVACHEVTEIPYDVTLSKVDVSVGVWGMYNFYKLQLIKHTAKNMFILFTRWGRIGSRGQFQHTPFQSLKEAAKEFCKIYKSKTGNDWNQTSQFQNHPKKWRLMPKCVKQRKQHKVDFNFETSLTSSLTPPVLDVITEISNLTMFQASISHIHLNEDFMPFGRMKRETLISARGILSDISELIDKATKLRNNLTTDKHAEYQSVCEEISQLTNEYYHLVPMFGFEYDTIRPISEKIQLREHTKLLGELMDMQVANTILLGANCCKKEVHPMDYVYRSLGCQLEPLAEGHPEAQFVLTNAHASVPSVRINRIFKVSREGESERLASLNMDNHQLLWHGSSMSNFISILSRGLLVAPPEVPYNGHLFGEGIYFADTFVKSASYCHNHSDKSTVKVMLLCEVALGNSKIDVKHGDEDHLDDDINSLKILGLHGPDTDFDARMPFGASLSLGQVKSQVYHPPARIQHNEYIIHNSDQVAIRYLVLFNG